jgi:hypothetical protein
MRVGVDAQIDMYQQDGMAALERVRNSWPSFVRSQLIRVSQLRICWREARARSALCAADFAAGDATGLLRSAERDAAALAREKDPLARPFACLIRATLLARQGRSSHAVTLLDEAMALFEALDMSLHSAAARWRLSGLVAGDRGRELKSAAARWMSGQNIKNYERMVALFAPGFP